MNDVNEVKELDIPDFLKRTPPVQTEETPKEEKREGTEERPSEHLPL